MSGPVVHLTWHLDVGGGELFLCDLARELHRRRVTQHVCTIGPRGPLAGELETDGIPVTPFHKTSKLGAVVIWRLAKALRRLRPSLVHTHGEAGIFWGLPAARLAGIPAVSLVYQNYHETPAKMRALGTLLRWPRCVIAGSRDVERFLRATVGVPENRLRTIACGIVPESFLAIRRRAVERPTIVTVGRLVERKGHRVLIEAVARVRQSHPTVHLVVIGDGPCLPALRVAVALAGLGDAVTFAGTVYPTHQVLASASLFVFPSLVEPQGLALLEAYAAGVPVVASRTGGIPEMLDDGVDGVLVRPGDVGELAAAIVRMLNDPAFGAACASRARRRLESFSVARIADQYVDLYRATVAEEPG